MERADIISAYMKQNMGVTGASRRWPVYRVSLEETDNVPSGVLVERGKPHTMVVEDLPAEMFNAPLQDVNVEDPENVRRFCEQYGLPPSPIYDGSGRLAEFRHRWDGHKKEPSYKVYANGYLLTPNCAPYSHIRRVLNSPELLAKSIEGTDYAESEPARLSELARRDLLNYKKALGVMSLAEAKQTLRFLQTMTVTPMLFNYLAENQGNADDLIAYLNDPCHVAQNGPDYSRYTERDIVNYTRLDDFDSCIEKSDELREQVGTGEKQGFNTRAGFNFALVEAFWLMVPEQLACLRSAFEAYNPTAIDLMSDDNSNPWAKTFSRMGRLVESVVPLLGEGSLPEAIIYQYSRVFSDPKPWRRCEQCGRIFKKYQEEGFDKNIRETRFCSRSCNIIHNNRKKQL